MNDYATCTLGFFFNFFFQSIALSFLVGGYLGNRFSNTSKKIFLFPLLAILVGSIIVILLEVLGNIICPDPSPRSFVFLSDRTLMLIESSLVFIIPALLGMIAGLRFSFKKIAIVVILVYVAFIAILFIINFVGKSSFSNYTVKYGEEIDPNNLPNYRK